MCGVYKTDETTLVSNLGVRLAVEDLSRILALDVSRWMMLNHRLPT